jgi:hypothetical protein
LARRITLCKSVLAVVLLYPMQSSLIPESISYEIEKICRRFIWGENEGKAKVHLIYWSTLCQSLLDGGLGLKKMHSVNKAFVMKL